MRKLFTAFLILALLCIGLYTAYIEGCKFAFEIQNDGNGAVSAEEVASQPDGTAEAELQSDSNKKTSASKDNGYITASLDISGHTCTKKYL